MNKECKLCGEKDSSLFYPKSKSKCKRCYIKHYSDAYQKNREEKIAYQKEWRSKNRDKVSAASRKNFILKKAGTPAWLSDEDKDVIKQVYRTAIEVSRDTGTPYHVDHIVPIVSKQACGLHVPWNLQVIPAHENMEKKSKLDFYS